MTCLKMDVNITIGGDWCKRFQEASPSERSIMLAGLMDAFNDGQEGIELSFSEPVINESSYPQ